VRRMYLSPFSKRAPKEPGPILRQFRPQLLLRISTNRMTVAQRCLSMRLVRTHLDYGSDAVTIGDFPAAETDWIAWNHNGKYMRSMTARAKASRTSGPHLCHRGGSVAPRMSFN
jgi:hypothetical protein